MPAATATDKPSRRGRSWLILLHTAFAVVLFPLPGTPATPIKYLQTAVVSQSVIVHLMPGDKLTQNQ